MPRICMRYFALTFISLHGATEVTANRVEEANPADSAANGTHWSPPGKSAPPASKSGLPSPDNVPVGPVPEQVFDVVEFLHETPSPSLLAVHAAATYGVQGPETPMVS